MKIAQQWARVGRQVKRKSLQVTGRPINNLVSVSVINAAELSHQYSGVDVDVLVEEGPTRETKITHLPQDEVEIVQPFRVECESVFLDIANPTFSLRNHLLLDGNMNVLFADLQSRESILSSREYAPRNVQKVTGTVAYLSNTWIDNYYHWMQLTLPLLRLYKRFRPDLKIDYFYLGESSLQAVQCETLAKLGIGVDKIIRRPCKADRIIAAMYLHRPQHGQARYRDTWGHDFVRALYCPVPGDPNSPKRIYVERGDARTRKILNETDLSYYLEDLGFVSVKMSGKSVVEQAKLFGNAEIIVGAHGAALTNVLFATEGTKLIEIFPPNVLESSYFTAATYSKLDYSYMVADGVAGGHMMVSLQKMTQLLRMNGV